VAGYLHTVLLLVPLSKLVRFDFLFAWFALAVIGHFSWKMLAVDGKA
jgi:hypothetical protein